MEGQGQRCAKCGGSCGCCSDPPPHTLPQTAPPRPTQLNHPLRAEGSYGTVFRAREKRTGRIYALKKIKLDPTKLDGFPQTSIREINVLLALHHPNIVNVSEVRACAAPVWLEGGGEGGGKQWGGQWAVAGCWDHRFQGPGCLMRVRFTYASQVHTSPPNCCTGIALVRPTPTPTPTRATAPACPQVVLGGGANNIFMVMEYLEHDMRALLEKEVRQQPFSTAQVRTLICVWVGCLWEQQEGLLQGMGAAWATAC